MLHDLDDRLTGETHLPSSDPDMAYTYDAKDRLTQADNALFTPIVGGVAGTPVSVSMDAMGNTINDGTRSFSYDATGRMVGVSYSSSSATYLVNSDGLRVRKSVTGIGATNEIVAYHDMRRRVGVYQANGSGGFTVKEELLYLPGSWRLVATLRGQVVAGSDGVAYPVLSDQIGTPRVVLDPSSGDRRWEWSAKEAFGLQAPNENPDSLTAGNFVFDARFPGQFLDAESGLFHNGYRDYDPKVGRYVESDPLGLGAGWNTYGYVGGQPTEAVDPLGLNFLGRCLAHKYEEENPSQEAAWAAIRKDRNSKKKVVLGSSSEAMRNAEHYLYAKKTVSANGVQYPMMVMGSYFWAYQKSISNSFEVLTAGIWDSAFTYSIPTLNEIAAGTEGAADGLLGRPASCDCAGAK